MKQDFDNTAIKEREMRYWGYDDTPMLIMLFIAIYVFVAFIMPTYIFYPVNVIGDSMVPTLYENDKVVLFRQGDIDYGDIVVLYAPNVYNEKKQAFGEDIIKRVMGLPGDTVWFEKLTEGSRTAYVLHRSHTENGMIVETILNDEYYVRHDAYGNIIYGNKYDINTKITLGEGEYFVLGDNREVSQDSRFDSVGKVKREQIIGKALLVIREGKILFDRVNY